MDTKEIKDIKDHKPIGHGPFFWCRSMGPLPSGLLGSRVKAKSLALLSMLFQMGYMFDSCVLDIDHLDLVMGKMMEQGPVLVITFTSQQILCVRDKSGKVVEGDPEKVMRIAYVWVLCRDQAELDPKAAWRLLELSASSQEQFLWERMADGRKCL